ncbi:MAG: ATP-binding protein [Theionarchaea archaeon]|nr:ATP-binding protein [Theionarchaea archaeon]
MSINWKDLRPLNNSQNDAFQELCRQLARCEKVRPGSIFIAKGNPDAGVECFWKFPDEDEWGWQAKFFRSPPDAGQWGQIDKSVKKALEKHPRLIRFTICLPIDRPDQRNGTKRSSMDMWNNHVKKWNGWAQEKGMSVEFEYWGEHEILERLSLDEHRGRFYFWFNKEFFSKQWFEDHVEEVISCVEPRHTPELNIELPIANLFDGLGLTSRFYTLMRDLYGEMARSHKKAQSNRVREDFEDEFDSLQDIMSELLLVLGSIKEGDIRPIDWRSIDSLIERYMEAVLECINALEAHFRQKQKPHGYLDLLGYEPYYLRKLLGSLRNLQDFVQSTQAELSNRPALLLVGKAGIGKTHLFCDVARHRINSGLPTILLLGKHFNEEEPWSQIIRSVGVSSKEEFLGALEAAAQAQGARSLIIIDALNEGEGKFLWHKYLAGMLTTLSRYSWIGIAVSVRISYEDIVIPKDLVQNMLLREEHYGFAEHEYQATRTFFDYYRIEQPSVPLLIPEFQNPLFLKLFCEGLNNSGLTRIPRGFRGATKIFDFFIESVNVKLHRPEYLDFDPRSQIIQRAVESLAEKMAEKSNDWLLREEAKAIVNNYLPRSEYDKSLFRHLISEGVIAEDRFRTVDSEWCEGICFSFERFGDHLIAKHLLDKHLDLNNPSQSFMPESPLGALVNDEHRLRNRGIIEALSIQLPERIGKELVEVAEFCAGYYPVGKALVESLIWRDPKAITEKTLDCLETYALRYRGTFVQFLHALLTIASDPEHPLNADFLHERLMKYSLAERDACWSIFAFEQYGEHESIDRLVDWAWSPEDKNHIDDESIRLCATALAWFLTTSHRYLRDRTTKALVNLLTGRIHVLRKVIRAFLAVNDPYVLERLLAVAYGCAMRSMDNDAVDGLAQDIYEWIFRNSEPPPDILSRDYARGVIELALHRGSPLDIDIEKIRPPYQSEWPSEIPAEEELKSNRWHEGMSNEELAEAEIHRSVAGYGDFARYIIGTNAYHFQWSSHRLGEPRELTRGEIYEDFLESLTDRQRKAWENYCSSKRSAFLDASRQHLEESSTSESYEIKIDGKKLESIEKAGKSFRRTLGKKKLKVYEEIIAPYLNDPNRHRDEYRFDLSIAQRWILQRVFDLGWNTGHFGSFDRFVSRSYQGRGANKPERMGKKYQWIAYHEFLARVSDNFEFRGDSKSFRPGEYDGPWQIGIRDIDPSLILKKTGREVWDQYTNTWWFPSSYNAWGTEPDDLKWLKSYEDIPRADSLIGVTDPDKAKWFTLRTFYSWEQPTPPEEDRFEMPRREIWYMIRSYIVRRSDIDELFEWAVKQDFMGSWMPESRDLYGVFLGELFWSPACKYYFPEYSSIGEWTRGYDERVPKEVLVTSEEYSWGHENYDCSLDDVISIYLPARWLVQHMGLRWNGLEGKFSNQEGELVALDPSVQVPGPAALLINRDIFLRFLNDNGYDILWTILGKKNIIGGMARDERRGQLWLSGAYRVLDGELNGKMTRKFISRD